MSNRANWNNRYAGQRGFELKWYVETPPEELLEVLRSPLMVKDKALDLGCGPGAITAHLCQHFKRVIGVDIAENGLRQARAHCSNLGVFPDLICGDARQLPLAHESADFIFDRGCLQGIPLADWPAYFAELERILRPQGIAQILCLYGREKLPDRSPWNFWRRRKERLKQLDDHRSPRQLPNHIPTAFEIMVVAESPSMLRNGEKIIFTHALIRKQV
jgi:ubiquinone/menaquinone biosynthesis C-methylase UbiE